MTQPIDIVQRQLDAYNARDLDTFAACFHDDIQMQELDATEPFADGMSDLREQFGDLFSRAPELHARLVNRIVQGLTVVDHESVLGMGTEDPVEAIAIYRVRDDKIAHVWFA
jgi:hypothetical protein